MSQANLTCRDEQRKADVRSREGNGIDYIEVSDDQRTLTVYFLRRAPEDIDSANVRIDGGLRIQQIQVTSIRLCVLDDPEKDDCMQVDVDRPGDYSTYTLRLVELDKQGQPTDIPLTGFDPKYAQVDFSFKVGCPSDLDCKTTPSCPPPATVTPEINYLAKDYASFRQLIFDRLAVTIPNWKEQHVPDEGVALVELLAYVADYLSYYQDAVATEAYLNTARKRISVRRHARLIDYAMHEGCNARALVQLQTDDVADPPIDPAKIYFVSGYEGPARGTTLTLDDLAAAQSTQYEVFEPVATDSIQIYQAHDQISFYTWGNQVCCLRAGATRAALLDQVPGPKPAAGAASSNAALAGKQADQDEYYPPKKGKENPPPPPPAPRILHLQAGDILIFEEALGPDTGVAADADSTHRHPVRLTHVRQSVDPLYGTEILEVQWSAADALPFELCLSSIGPAPGCALLSDVSVARGNIVLVDNGMRIPDERLGTVPAAETKDTCEDVQRAVETVAQPANFQPTLQQTPITFRQDVQTFHPAAVLLIQDPRGAKPCIWVTSIPPLPDGSGPLFSFDELTDPQALAVRLAKPQDEGSRFLRAHYSAQVLQELDKYDPSTPLSQPLAVALLAQIKPLLRSWTPQPDLLSSHDSDFHFVAEIDDDGIAHLRFGEGELGRAPEAGESFSATYRIGNGIAGNVGSEAIDRVVFRTGAIPGIRPRNPLSAQGGVEPEPIAEVQSFAPGTFRKQLERAITADDYARLAERNPKVQRAAATLLWTGNHFEAHVAIDPLGTETPDPQMLAEIQGHVHRYRRVGHDVIVVPATYVSLYISMTICVLPNYLRGHVEAALLDVFSDRVLASEARGFFHPDNLTFGDNIYLSKLVAAAQSVTGVQSVVVNRLERLFQGANGEIESGVLEIGALEVARLDNDPSVPENGTLVLTLRGGR
jgi:hypothetical protein